MSGTQSEVWVVVAAHGAPAHYLKEDGTRYGPIVFETDVSNATREEAQRRAAQVERDGYGSARIARLQFSDEITDVPF